jgi:hypothetical protein
MARYSGSGWHFQSIRHSNARKYGRAGGKYAIHTAIMKGRIARIKNEKDFDEIGREICLLAKNDKLDEKSLDKLFTPFKKKEEELKYKKNYGKTLIKQEGTITTYKNTYEPNETATITENQGRTHFKNKEHRDEVAKILKSKGYKIKMDMSHNQRLHPEYIADYEGTYETGFGNADYQTFWNKLYNIEIIDKKNYGKSENITIPRPKGLRANDLPIQIKMIVPSTTNNNQPIGDEEFNKRIEEVKKYFDKKFGADTTITDTGGYFDGDKWITEKGNIVESSTTIDKYKKNINDVVKFIRQKRKDYGQDSMFLGIEGRSYIIPNKNYIDDDKSVKKKPILVT